MLMDGKCTLTETGCAITLLYKNFSLMEQDNGFSTLGDQGEATMKRFGCCVVMVSIVLVSSSAWADSLYRCADGTFTNKAERQCPPYQSKWIVRVQTTVGAEQTSEVTR